MESNTEFLEVANNQEQVVFNTDGTILLVTPGSTAVWEVVTNAVLNLEENPPEITVYDLTAVHERGAP